MRFDEFVRKMAMKPASRGKSSTYCVQRLAEPRRIKQPDRCAVARSRRSSTGTARVSVGLRSISVLGDPQLLLWLLLGTAGEMEMVVASQKAGAPRNEPPGSHAPPRALIRQAPDGQ